MRREKDGKETEVRTCPVGPKTEVLSFRDDETGGSQEEVTGPQKSATRVGRTGDLGSSTTKGTDPGDGTGKRTGPGRRSTTLPPEVLEYRCSDQESGNDLDRKTFGSSGSPSEVSDREKEENVETGGTLREGFEEKSQILFQERPDPATQEGLGVLTGSGRTDSDSRGGLSGSERHVPYRPTEVVTPLPSTQ